MQLNSNAENAIRKETSLTKLLYSWE